MFAVAGDPSSSPGRKPSRGGVLAPRADGGRERRRGESRGGPGPGSRDGAVNRRERGGWGGAAGAGGEPSPVEGRENASGRRRSA